MNTLYIIGNGFDLFHSIKSRYADFKDYVAENDTKLKIRLEELFNADDLWWNFEETLAEIDIDEIRDRASRVLTSYGDENWKDSGHHDYQFEISQELNLVTVELIGWFKKWVLQLAIPNHFSEVKLNLSNGGKYLNFNYTRTLEALYKISPSHITYIHNKAIDESSILILGHSRKPINKLLPSEKLNEDEFDEVDDSRISEGEDLIADYFSDTYKPTEQIIGEKVEFYNGLTDIDEIHVLGHSLSTVDIRYFEEIIKRVNKQVVWRASYYGANEHSHHKKILLKLGVPITQIELSPLEEIYAQQPKLL